MGVGKSGCFSVCGAEQEAAKSSARLPKSCPSGRMGKEAVFFYFCMFFLTLSPVRAAGAHIFAQCCMSNRVLTLQRICFPSVGKKKHREANTSCCGVGGCPENIQSHSDASRSNTKPNTVFFLGGGARKVQTDDKHPHLFHGLTKPMLS